MSACSDGRIAAIGKAGNPDTQPGVTIIIGPGTEAIAGEGKILTAGGMDAHIHFICPQQIEEALMSGITTMLGGGTGPAHGTLATTCTPGAWHLARMIAGVRRLPDEHRPLRQGQRLAARRAGGDGAGRRLLAEAARGLGHDAGRDRLLPVGRRRVRRAGDDPHRHAERERLRRGHDRAPSRAAPSTPSTPKAPAAAMRPTSSRSAACRTSSRPRPTRRGPTRSTRSPSISTC